MKTLSDICEVYSGFALKEFNDLNEGIPVIKIGNIMTDGTLALEECQYTSEIVNEKYYSKKGDIYVALSGATTGKIGILESDERHVINQRVGVIRRKDDKVPQQFIKYFLMRQTDRIMQEASGCAQPNISPKQIAQYEVPRLSKTEMYEISTILDMLSNVITQRKDEIQKLEALIKARFVELFGDLMENPLGWPVMTIADVSTFLKSGLSRKLSDDDIGLPVIRSGNIQDGQFIFDDVKYWYIDDPQGANTKDYILNDGDVLVNFINSSSQIGKTAIYRDTGRDCIYTTNIFRMKLADNCNEYYYNWFAMSDYYYRHLQSIIQPAVNQASFTTVNFLKLPIPLPPKEKQGEFADFVKQVDKSKIVVQKALDEARLLFDSLMQEYFG